MKRNNLWVLLTAFAMTFLLVGTVLAATGASNQGVTPTTVDGKNIGLPSEGGNEENKDLADCAADTEVWESVDAHAIKTGNTGGSETTESGVTVTWTYDSDTKEFGFSATGGLVTIAYVKGGNGYNEYDYTGFTDGGVASDGGMFAPDNGSDGPAGLSHAVFCTAAGGTEETEAPSFEASVGAETDAPSADPSFFGSVGDLTEPPTDTLGERGASAPADSAWLLVVALGVLLASIVVLTPARAKSRR